MWHDLKDPKDPALDAFASQYNLHPLHVEDCRSDNQRAKVEDGAGYLFAVLKPVHIDGEGKIGITGFDIFLGHDFVITVQHDECQAVRSALDQLRANSNGARPDQIFYKIFDVIADAYLPPLDWFNEEIDELEDIVLEKPSPETLQRIFSAKRGLIELRRVLSNMRDVAGHIQRSETKLVQPDLWPFLRDI